MAVFISKYLIFVGSHEVISALNKKIAVPVTWMVLKLSLSNHIAGNSYRYNKMYIAKGIVAKDNELLTLFTVKSNINEN